ncbi:cuticle protein 2-like [Episyrphus balteatus]|uniref:cuticle protein 2-like n=1 Tax=Episyrphus balteatus TaxID=286459 RepID=UPI002485CC16|nr:cuticle protein 2-like [Episyrphus balteatus]
MNIVPILCLLFIVAKAEILKADSQVKSESGLGPSLGPKGIESSFLDSVTSGHNGGPIMGRFVYDGEDGQQFEVFYFADAYGYQAQGRLIERSHPLSSSIDRWNMRITLEGKYGSISD